MNKRLLLFTCILLVVAGLTSWITVKIAKKSINHPSNTPHRPDAYMYDIEYKQIAKNGQLKTKLHSPYLEHYPWHDSSKFIAPKITIYRSNQQPWIITANHGTSDHGADIINLVGDVRMHQAAGAHNQELTITTSQITINLKQKLAHTNQPLKLTRPGLLVTATGATANLATKQLRLLHNVHQQRLTNQPAVLDAQQALYNRLHHMSTYLGNVHMRQTTTSLKASSLIVYDDLKTNKIYKLVATGQPVHYSTLPPGKQYKVYAEAKVMIYYPQQHLAVLQGNVKVNQHNNSFTGQYCKYNTTSGTVLLTPATNNSVKIVIQPT